MRGAHRDRAALRESLRRSSPPLPGTDQRRDPVVQSIVPTHPQVRRSPLQSADQESLRWRSPWRTPRSCRQTRGGRDPRRSTSAASRSQRGARQRPQRLPPALRRRYRVVAGCVHAALGSPPQIEQPRRAATPPDSRPGRSPRRSSRRRSSHP